MRSHTFLPSSCAAFGLALAGCAVLPIIPDSGLSVVNLVIAAIADDWLNGLMLALTLGLPYGFGFAVAVCAGARGRFGATAVKATALLLVLEVSLLALLLAHSGEGLAPWALLGVTGTALLSVLVQDIGARTRGVPTPTSFYTRWGAVLTAATFGWLRLQFIGHEPPGVAVIATCGCAALLAAAARGSSQRSASVDSEPLTP